MQQKGSTDDLTQSLELQIKHEAARIIFQIRISTLADVLNGKLFGAYFQRMLKFLGYRSLEVIAETGEIYDYTKAKRYRLHSAPQLAMHSR
ncbi:hypothetical protein ANTPLA_LOCUS1420 [Anthophora plagiata]